MEEFNLSLRLIMEYGLSGILGVIVIWFGYHPEYVGKVYRWLRGFRRPVSGVDLTVRKINQCILFALEGLVSKYDACRGYVFEYDEYDDRIKPLPWAYCNCTYEVCHKARQVDCESDSLQHIPLSAIPYWQERLGKDGSVCLHDIDVIRETDLESWKILARQTITSVYCIGLVDFRGKPIGFLGLDYCNGRPSKLKRSEDITALTFEAVKIAGLLAMKNNGSLEHLAGTI